MLSIINLRVLLEEKVHLVESVGEFEFRILQKIMEVGDEIYFKSFSDDDEAFPVRITPPPGGFRRAEKRAIEEKRPFNIYIATLDEPSFETLVQGISEITRNENRFTIDTIPVRLILFNTIKSKLYRDLLTSHISRKIKIKFEMPYLMKMESYDKFPIPTNILNKAEDMWEFFSRESLPCARISSESVSVESYFLKGQKMHVAGQQFFGIDGEMEIEIKSNDEDVIRKINALLHFTEFSGIGLWRRYSYGSLKIIHL